MLKDTDHVVTAYAQSAAGPGWANSPVWVVIRSKLDGALRIEAIQPEDQTAEMHTLYQVSAAAHISMTRAAIAALQENPKLAA